MELPVSPADLQQAVEWLNKGVAMSESPEKKYTAKDMIEFGLTCSLALKKRRRKRTTINCNNHGIDCLR